MSHTADRRRATAHTAIQRLPIPVGARWARTAARTRVRLTHTAADTAVRPTVVAHTNVHPAAMVVLGLRLTQVDSVARDPVADSAVQGLAAALAVAGLTAEVMCRPAGLEAEDTSAVVGAATLAEAVAVILAEVVDTPVVEAMADATNFNLLQRCSIQAGEFSGLSFFVTRARSSSVSTPMLSNSVSAT